MIVKKVPPSKPKGQNLKNKKIARTAINKRISDKTLSENAKKRNVRHYCYVSFHYRLNIV